MNKHIQQSIRYLGVTGNYRGYKQLCLAVELVLLDENRIFNLKRDVYQIIATTLGCNVITVERNIRTLINRVWQTNPDRISNLAGFPLQFPPTTGELIDILANYVRCKTI